MAILRNQAGIRRAPFALLFACAAALCAFLLCVPGQALAATADGGQADAANPQLTNDANSFRYKSGQLIGIEDVDLLSSESYQEFDTMLTFDGYVTVNRVTGSRRLIPGAIAKGVDVSKYNREIDWSAAKDDGVKFAIIQCGYGSNIYSEAKQKWTQDDPYWEDNASECERLGIPYGVYLYSYAQNTEMAESEADHVLRLIAGHNVSYPIYFDMEDSSQLNAAGGDPAKLAEIASAFCDKIEAAGYRAGIYANQSWFENYLTDPAFDQWDHWVASYGISKCTYDGDYSMWQLSSGGRVDGINYPEDDEGGRVDVNLMYRTSYPDDVSADDWYVTSGAFDYVDIRGFMGLYTGTNNFGPYDSLERGMVATILWRMAGCPWSGESYPFDDVSEPDAYYYDAVCWAKEQGIISGYRNADGTYTNFGPTDKVTREQLACMFARYANLNDGLDTSSDCSAMEEKDGAAQVSDYARGSMGWAVDVGLINGVNGNELRPQDNAWRASMAQLVQTYSRIYLDSL